MKHFAAALLTTDTHKGDRELKLLWKTTDGEIAAAQRFLTSNGMRVDLRWRDTPSEKG